MPGTLSQRWRKLQSACRRTPEVPLHDFRALYVTEGLAAEIDVGIMSPQVGHARSDFTRDAYQRPRRKNARADADAIEVALGDTFATPSVDTALTGAGGDVVPITPTPRDLQRCWLRGWDLNPQPTD